MSIAGLFRDRVTIQRATESRGTDGSVTLTWATLRPVWCAVNDLTVREYLAADSERGRRTTKLTTYWQHVRDVTPKDRVSFNGRTLDVIGVLRSGDGFWGTLMCEEVTT